MALVVKLQHVVDEMDTLSDELLAYLNKQTGQLITISNEELQAAEEGDDIESYPDWQKEAIQKAQEILDTADYLPLPRKFDLDEYSTMKQFCNELEDAELSNELVSQIKGSGAFRRFKHAIDRYLIADHWYRYRQRALEKIAIDWLEANSIPYEISEGSMTMKLEGTWHITEMDQWDEDYFNMEVQAYITVDKRGSGDFQFGLVSGTIDGELVKDGSGEKLEFTWEGSDENDEAFGSGWLRLKDKNTLEGKIKFHQGDSSLFSAKRA